MKDERILRLPQVIERVGLKKSAIYKMISENEFPRQVKLGSHASGWIESEVSGWIVKRIEPNALHNGMRFAQSRLMEKLERG